MTIKIDPKSPILWVRVSGLDEWRTVVVSAVGLRTPLEPEPKQWRLLLEPLDVRSENKVVPVKLDVDDATKQLLVASLRLYGYFAPDKDTPISVELFHPKDAAGNTLPEPVLKVPLKWNDELRAVVDVAVEAS